ncbi:homeobox-leucine zipper protein HDG8-like [Solanum pennellii]|uniref:Homeobox-leucine zipper protein HDG8-like n=1 Tax=Solanum pennellii TaxID=28526 RepID=A0ABM1HSR6_SOLPN|nr:homeobox-leucine zipper protein HDG8-like [Solanum pennellii]
MTDSGESTSKKKSEGTTQVPRYSVEQIQQLEEFFKKCDHPDEDQREQLSREVGLDPKGIKFWFQNKITQTKIMNERSDNESLQIENERLRCDNKSMKEKLENAMCPQCDDLPIGKEERALHFQKMKMENQWLREQTARLSKIISSTRGKSVVTDSNLTPPADESLLRQIISGSSIGYPPPINQENNNNSTDNVRAHSININNIPIISPLTRKKFSFHRDNGEQSIFSYVVVPAMIEMCGLFHLDNPCWVKSSTDESWLIHREYYDKAFPNPNRSYKSSTARIESSRDCGVVPMTAIELIQIFLDPIKWMNMFPTIVTEARILDFLDSGDMGISIQLMYEKLHILSPLVDAREFFFIRCCKQLDHTTWIMVDVSYDLFKEIQTGAPSYAWKFPSGCIIQDMGDHTSLVTWIEHVQVDEKNQVNHIFRDLLFGRQTYGAKRWIVTLQRMCERYNFPVDALCPTRHGLKEVVNDISEGLQNVKQISQRMVKSFCEILSMTQKLDFSTSSKLNNTYRVSIRENEETTQSKGFIATAATSLWFPFAFKTIFNFLKDDKTRYQWDVFAEGNNVTELVRVLTGTLPGNDITIIQSHMLKENNMLLLEESSIDEMGAFLIYGPIDLPIVTSITNEGDATKVDIFPLGIIISPDGRLASERGNNGSEKDGSILTVAFQKLICTNNNPISQDQRMEAVTSVLNLLSSTVLHIKAALGCFD